MQNPHETTTFLHSPLTNYLTTDYAPRTLIYREFQLLSSTSNPHFLPSTDWPPPLTNQLL